MPFVGMITEKWAKNDGCIYKSSPMVCRDNCAHRVARRDRPEAITPPLTPSLSLVATPLRAVFEAIT